MRGKIEAALRLLFFLVPAALLVLPSKALPAESITGSGCSVSNTGYLADLAKEYERKTGVRIFVRGGGSVVGIEDLRSGKVDFAAACRDREAGDPDDVEFVQVAWDALVFIVHKSNQVDNITLEDADAVYSGKVRDWSRLKGPVMPIKIFISRPRKGLSGVEASTKKMILKGKDPVATPHTTFVASTGIVEQMVEDTPEGFAVTGYTSARKRNIKMLKVGGIIPNAKNIVSGRYKLKRPLYILLPKNAKPSTKKFVDYVLGEEGQKFIRAAGVVSLTDIK